MSGIEREPLARPVGAAAAGHQAQTSLGEDHAHSVVGPVGFTGGQPDLARTSESRMGHSAGGAPDRPAGQPAMGSGSGGGSAPVPSGAAGPVNLPPTDLPDTGDQTGGDQAGEPGATEAAPEAVMRDRFQLDFLQLLDGRLASIENNIGTQHYEEARIAMLSLEAASGMLGAQRLVGRLRELRGIVDIGPASKRAALLNLVRADAADVRRALETTGSLDASDSVL